MVWRSDRARNIFNSSGPPSNAVVSEESSESEFAEGEEKPWPPERRLGRCRARKQEAHAPRPHSHLFRLSGGRSRGSKHARRWENSMFLSSLHEIPEEEFEAAANILPSHNSPFSRLHCSDKHMQVWCSFDSCSEEQQLRLTSARGNSTPEEGRGLDTVAPPIPEQSFMKIDSHIRAVLRRNRRLPTGILADVEEELRFLFSVDPHGVVLILQANSFCRLLLHGISQYLGLHSTTHGCHGSSVVVVECEDGCFHPPELPLTTHVRCKNKPGLL